MSDYSQAIASMGAVPRSRPGAAEVPSLVALLLPNFGAVVFAVALLQVLFLSQGAQALFRDSDTGWHVRNGETILETAAAPRVDNFSYTREGRPWFAWEWLSDALLGGAYRIGGLTGVALLAAVAIALTVWGAARLSLSLGGNLFFTAAAMVLLLGVTSIHWLARPHVFSWLLSLLFLSIAEHERRKPNRFLYALPLLACLWANLHGSFLLGPAILFIYAIGSFPSLKRRGGCADQWGDRPLSNQEGRRRRCTEMDGPVGPTSRKGADGVVILEDSSGPTTPALRATHPFQGEESFRFAATCLVSLLATFINPYGWRLHEHVLTYLQNDYLMDRIAEFRSFSFHAPGALYVELFLFAAVLGTVAMLRQRAFGQALLALGLLHMSLYSARHLPTAAVLLLPLCVGALTQIGRAHV